MAAWTRYLEMVINLGGRGLDTLLRSAAAVTPLKASDIVQNDEFPLRLRFVLPTNDSGNPLDVVQIEAGSIIVFSGKQTSALGGSTLLYYCGDFTEDQDEVGYYYEGILNTNTTETAAAFAALASGKTTLEVINEVEIQNADNTQRTSYQHNGILRRQVYNGETTPVPAAPAYPAAAAIPNFLSGVSALTGSDAAALAGQVTAGISVPRIFETYCDYGGETKLRRYVLRAGTDAQALPGIVRPNDYDGSTNAKVYELQG